MGFASLSGSQSLQLHQNDPTKTREKCPNHLLSRLVSGQHFTGRGHPTGPTKGVVASGAFALLRDPASEGERM